MIKVGEDLVNGLKEGIGNAKDAVIGKVKEVGGSVLSKFKGIFDEHSPSKETEKIGEYLGEGLANGIDGSKKGVLSSVGDMANGVLDFFSDLFEGGDFLGGIKKLFKKLADLLGDAGKTVLEGISKALGLDFGNLFGEGVEQASVKATKALEKVADPSLWTKIKGKTKKALDDMAKYFDTWANSSVKKY